MPRFNSTAIVRNNISYQLYSQEESFGKEFNQSKSEHLEIFFRIISNEFVKRFESCLMQIGLKSISPNSNKSKQIFQYESIRTRIDLNRIFNPNISESDSFRLINNV